MKKICLLYDFLEVYGGLERVMRSQAEWLSSTYEVSVSFGSVNKKLINFFPSYINLTEHSPKFLLSKTLKIIYTFINRRSLNHQKDVSLFISHSFICSKLAYNMKKRYKIPYIVFIHHPPNFLYKEKGVSKWIANLWRLIALTAGIIIGPILRKIDIKIVKAADLILVNSKYTQKRVEKIYKKNSIVVYPTTDKKFKVIRDLSNILKKFNLPKNFIFCTGRLVPDKRYDFLVESLSKLENLSLVFAGNINDKYKNKLKHLAKKRNCAERIVFLGFVSDKDLIALYNAAKAFAFPAPKEDFGLVPIESIACGTPVVAWGDNAGPSETILSGINGYLAKPYDTSDFAKKITLSTDLKNNNLSKTISKFKEKNQSIKFTKLISELLIR